MEYNHLGSEIYYNIRQLLEQQPLKIDVFYFYMLALGFFFYVGIVIQAHHRSSPEPAPL